MIVWRRLSVQKPDPGQPILIRDRQKCGKMKYTYHVNTLTRPAIKRPDKYVADYWQFEEYSSLACGLDDREIAEDYEWVALE